MNQFMRSTKGFAAVQQPQFTKIESRVNQSGLALNTTRTEVKTLDLVMDYTATDGTVLMAGRDRVIVAGDSGLNQWAKKLFEINGAVFVFAPDSSILGYIVNAETE